MEMGKVWEMLGREKYDQNILYNFFFILKNRRGGDCEDKQLIHEVVL